jgi:hypothetical protein
MQPWYGIHRKPPPSFCKDSLKGYLIHQGCGTLVYTSLQAFLTLHQLTCLVRVLSTVILQGDSLGMGSELIIMPYSIIYRWKHCICQQTLTRCLPIRFVPLPQLQQSLLQCWLQHSRTWAVMSACISTRTEINFNIFCNSAVISSTTVCGRQVSFQSANYCCDL